MAGYPDWLPIAGLALLIVILAAAELWRPFHRGQDNAAARIPSNFGLGIINMAVGGLLPVTAVAAAEWSRVEEFGLLHWLVAPPAASIAATLIIRSLLGYWLHRLAHRVPLLWRMHQIHHCDTIVDVSTGFRHHPLELVYVAAIGAGVAALIGLSPLTLAAYEVVALGFGLWTHANTSLPERVDRGVTILLMTPCRPPCSPFRATGRDRQQLWRCLHLLGSLVRHFQSSAAR
jgi:sterol desaturase/sphingolipid hydroxylase (fatty acid hydroxylase superfamily)